MTKRGFTLFFAMLAASLALAIGLAVYDLTVREINISLTVSQSEYAIYAADTGAECALYWDVQHSVFATSSTSAVPTSGVVCNTQDIAASPWTITAAANAATTTFNLSFTPQPYCATVTVAKSGTPTFTTIVAHGYNNCTGAGLQLERALQVKY